MFQGRIDTLRSLPERWRWLGYLLRVQRRFGEVRGGEVASAVTLSAFLSIFPLLLVLIAVVGFVSANSADLAGKVVENMGLSGDAATAVTDALAKAEESRKAASVIGFVGLLWSGLGLVSSLQSAYNSVWQVRGRGLKDKGVGLAWLAGSGVLLLTSFAVTGALNWLPGPVWVLGIAASLAIDAGLFLWSSKLLPNRDAPWRALLPGAIVGAVGLEALKLIGAVYVPRAVASSSGLYGSIGVVFALLAWLFFFARLVVYSAVVNVLHWEEEHGTVVVQVDAPRIPGEVPVEGTRGGQVTPV